MYSIRPPSTVCICAAIQPDSSKAKKAPARLSFISCLPPALVVGSRAQATVWSMADGHDTWALLAGIDNGLIGGAEHPLHGFEIDPLPRHVGSFLVLLVNLREARSLALGFGDGLFTISFGVLEHLGGAAARF